MLRRFVVVLATLAWIQAAAPSPAAAQQAATEAGADRAVAPASVSVAERLRPTLASALLLPGPTLEHVDRSEIEPPPALQRNPAGIPLMAAGGVLFVAGAIVGGDAGTVLMLGGAGIGAYGVYLYFR